MSLRILREVASRKEFIKTARMNINVIELLTEKDYENKFEFTDYSNRQESQCSKKRGKS